jgi:hypothetical protein
MCAPVLCEFLEVKKIFEKCFDSLSESSNFEAVAGDACNVDCKKFRNVLTVVAV